MYETSNIIYVVLLVSTFTIQQKIKYLKNILTHTDACIIITSSGESNHQHVEQKDLDSNSNPITYIT